MVDRAMAQFDCQDPDTEEFFRKGLQAMYKGWDGARLKSALMQYGSYLTYEEELSDIDAAMLRRFFSKEPPVTNLYVTKISQSAFRTAFHGQGEYPPLKEVFFHLIDCEGQDLGIDRCKVFGHLRSLDLACINVGSGFAKEIASYIRETKSLEELWLHLSCGGDEGVAAIIEALKVNDTLKEVALFNMGSLPQSLFGNTAPPLSPERLSRLRRDEIVWSLLAQERHAGVFKRILIEWPEQLLPQLTELIRKEACCPKLHVSVSFFVDRGILQEFLDALAAHKSLLELHIYPPDQTFLQFEHKLNALAECIVSILKHTTTLRELYNCMPADHCHLVSILDALKGNRSVTSVTMDAEVLTGEVAKSLAELLAVNKTLIYVCILYSTGGLPGQVKDVLQALRTNYTLNTLDFGLHADCYPLMGEVKALLGRNVRLKNRAAEFVVSGADVSDEEGVDALTKVQASAALVERVEELTGKTTEEVLQKIHSALARLPM
ncbi:hypothetical protein MRX96_017082 [Rhipicephalus microplus]